MSHLHGPATKIIKTPTKPALNLLGDFTKSSKPEYLLGLSTPSQRCRWEMGLTLGLVRIARSSTGRSLQDGFVRLQKDRFFFSQPAPQLTAANAHALCTMLMNSPRMLA